MINTGREGEREGGREGEREGGREGGRKGDIYRQSEALAGVCNTFVMQVHDE